jgi:ABC-type transporter Mla subunit MlaD
MDLHRPSVRSLLAGVPGLSGLRDLPGPGELVQLAGRAVGAVEQAVGLVPRLVTVVGQVETLMDRVTTLLERIERTDSAADDLVRRTGTVIDGAQGAVRRTDAVIGGAEHAVQRTDAVIDGAEGAVRRTGVVLDSASPLVDRTGVVLGDAEQLLDRAAPLLTAVQPVLERLLPIVSRIADTTSPDEVDAVVKLIDQLPDLVAHLDADIVPILDTFGTVAPDVRDLLDIVRELNEMLASVPGLGKVKQRIEEQQAAEDEEARLARYTADEVPPSAPARKELPADVS